MRLARRARARGAADAVDVVLGVLRQVPVDDVAHALDVQPPRGHVGGDEDGQLALLEVVEDLEPPLLIHVAGERARHPAVAAQAVLEPARLLARVREDEDAAAALAAQEPQEQVELLLAPHVVEELLGLLGRLLLGRDRDLGGVVHELPGQLHHPERQRRREEERLALLRLRQPAQDEAEVRDEAHVEHPVGLVDDEHLDLAGRPDVLLEVVDEAARACPRARRSPRAGPRAACCSRCRRRRRGS